MAARLYNLVGQRFGRLTVLEWLPKPIGPSKWRCLCDCGNEKLESTGHLKEGNVKSCGCLLEETKTLNCKSNSREYTSWYAMIQRCYGSMDQRYKDKERLVCDAWLGTPDGFLKFLSDMGPRPQDTTLERIDNSKGYHPENCKWEIKGVQAYNRDLFVNSTSGRTGVYYRKDSNKWRAKISFENLTISLGQFNTYEEAVTAREEAEIKYYGYTKK